MSGLASRSELRMSFLRYAVVTVPAVVLLGTLSGYLSNSGSSNPEKSGAPPSASPMPMA